MAVANQGIAIQVALAFLFTAMEKLRGCIVLVLACIAIDGEGNEIRAGLTQSASQLILRFEEREPAFRLYVWVLASCGVHHERKALGRDARQMVANFIR